MYCTIHVMDQIWISHLSKNLTNKSCHMYHENKHCHLVCIHLRIKHLGNYPIFLHSSTNQKVPPH